jgi:hypothetical protein
VIGRHYFMRQAETLLKSAQSTTDPHLAAILTEEAADLKALVDELSAPDGSHRDPDAEPEIEQGETDFGISEWRDLSLEFGMSPVW